MKQYLDVVEYTLKHGTKKQTRSGEVLSCFGNQMRFDLKAGFPAVTTKKLQFNSVVTELLWFLSGSTNTKYLHEHNCHIWDEWASQEGNLKSCYGKQWRKWQTVNWKVYSHFSGRGSLGEKYFYALKEIDQIQNIIDLIKKEPESRRLILNAWNPGEVEEAALPWCHSQVQFNVTNNELSCHLTQRSADLFLGVPFNIASYSLLTHMIAQVCDLGVGEFVHSLGDYHLYSNHLEQVKLLLTREPLPLPKLWLDPSIKNIDDFKHEHIKLVDYTHHPAIKAQVSV